MFLPLYLVYIFALMADLNSHYPHFKCSRATRATLHSRDLDSAVLQPLCIKNAGSFYFGVFPVLLQSPSAYASADFSVSYTYSCTLQSVLGMSPLIFK